MIYQAQFLAVAGKIGGPQGQPESSQALSEGMGWANYHLFSLNGDSEDEEDENVLNATGDSRRRRGQGMRRTQREGEGDRDYFCRLAAEDPAELGATVLMSVAATVGAFFGRSGVVRLLWFYREHKGLERGPAAMPFPSWEVQVFLTQFQGLAEAAGLAITSGCFPYEFGGAIVLLILLLSLVAFGFLCWHGFQHKVAVWNHIPFKEAFSNMKEAIKGSGEERGLARVSSIMGSWDILVTRGEWEGKDHPDHEDTEHVVYTQFHDRYGALYDSAHGKAWWYGLWSLFRALALGVILSAVLSPRSNAASCLVLGLLDSGIHVFWHPDGQWVEMLKNMYRGLMNVAVIAAVLSYIEGTMPENIFSNVFQYISIVSMVPMIVSALLGPIISVFKQVYACYSCVTGVGAGAGGVAAVGGLAVVALDSGDVMDEIQAARDEEKEKKEHAAADIAFQGGV